MRTALLTGCSRSTPTAYAAPLAPAPSRAGAFCLERLRMRKLRPRFRLQNGTCFPFGALGGNYIPELALRTGCAFLFGPSAETTSRNPVPEWDALSGSALNRKLCPGIMPQNGMRFPLAGRLESASQFERLFRDTVSARHAIWKAHPVLSAQSGTRFPRVLPTGKCVPVWWTGGHKLSSPYSSISLSHVGSAVCRMPAVCSFLASIPAERTSLMVKRSRG